MTRAVRSFALALAFAVFAAGAGRADLVRVESVGSVPLAAGSSGGANARQAALEVGVREAVERAALDLVLPGGSWQWLFWAEWVVGGLVPFVLLVVPRWRTRPVLIGIASLLVLVGVYAFRIELVVGGMVKPLLQLPPGNAIGTYTPGETSFQFDGAYHPTWVEYAIVAGLMAFLALLITLDYRWLRSIDPSEVEE